MLSSCVGNQCHNDVEHGGFVLLFYFILRLKMFKMHDNILNPSTAGAAYIRVFIFY